MLLLGVILLYKAKCSWAENKFWIWQHKSSVGVVACSDLPHATFYATLNIKIECLSVPVRNIILHFRKVIFPNLSKSLYVMCAATIRSLPTRPYWHFLTRNILVVHRRNWFHSQIISNLSQETSISVGLGLNCPFYHQVCQLLISLDGKILGDFQTQCYVSWSLHPTQAAVGRHQGKVLTTTFGKSGYATLARVLLHPSRLWTERVWSTQQHHQAISRKETQFKPTFHKIYGTSGRTKKNCSFISSYHTTIDGSKIHAGKLLEFPVTRIPL